MTILVTGATGQVGAAILDRLHGADIRALTRDPARLGERDVVTAVQGDLTDPVSIEAALQGVDTLFLLTSVSPDEANQAMMAVNLAKAAGVRGIVYLSVSHAGRYVDTPHYASKHLVERMIWTAGLPATILRANYFMQNDLTAKDALLEGVFPQPIGEVGVAMVDVRDIADAAVAELLRRHQADASLPATLIEVCGPEVLTAADVAAIWTDALGLEVSPGSADLGAFEAGLRHRMPAWMAHDLARMFSGFQREGMVPAPQAAATMEQLIGHPLRRYRDFAQEAVASWRT
ncbi:NmrA family NAD(P)-binding protein [Halomonas sp. PAMB 3232]|uniref:SDR family oxidoreductase n=1 Tax=Halomonas sp. PAMB 3232 TaxID=3075221 RepID=UPI00289F0DE3|nr:NmrA family NAD(P)-binding protein [Halomonas sp. PAMB 3232]WNL40004.1 NmrA family NAD(P)-binding protein [Halomonas sp. PAMB 3232]